MASLASLKKNMFLTIVLIFGVLFALLVTVSWYLELPTSFALILTLIFIFFQWLLSPTIVRMSLKLRYLRKGENPFLEEIVQKYSKKAEIPKPRLAIVEDSSPNAFVFGRDKKSQTLAVHTGLLEKLRKDEIEGVVCHELGHIKHNDSMIMTFASAIPLLSYILARGFFEGSRFKRKKVGSLILVAIFSYMVYLVSQLLVLYLSRSREYYADSFSAYLNNPSSLSSALAKITYGLSLSSDHAKGVRAFYIGDPTKAREEITPILKKADIYDLNKDGVLDERELEHAMELEAKNSFDRANELFSTHPPTFKRIMLLKKIEEEMRQGELKNIYKYI